MGTPEKPVVVDDPDAPPTEEELAAAARLREALEGGAAQARDDGADLLRAAALAHSPRAIDPEAHRAIVEAALTRVRAPSRRGRVIRVAFGVGAGLALAASVTLLVRGGPGHDGAAATVGTVVNAAPLAQSRSTQPLFDEPFARSSHVRASTRIDRIAVARGGDLRENRFARWGVK